MASDAPDGRGGRVLSRITDAVVELDEKLHCVYANTEAEALFETETGNLDEYYLWNVSPGDSAALRTKIEYAVDKGTKTRIEQYDEATNRQLRFNIYPSDNGITVLITTNIGTTEQSTAASGIDQSVKQETGGQCSIALEQVPTDVSEQIPIHIFAKDREARHRWVTGGLVDNPNELLGKRDTELNSPATNSFSEEALADDWRVLEDGVEIIDKEEYNEQLNKWFLTSKVPCRDEEGNIVGLFGYAFDITERKMREQSLTELQRQTQRLIETSTIKQTAEVAVSAARDVLDAPLCGVYQVDEAEEILSPVASVESFPEDFGGAPTYSQDHSDDRAAEIVWDTFNSGTKREIDTVNSVDGLAGQTPAESALLYPLGDRGMFIVSALEPRAFDDVQKRYFELLALSLQTAFERVEREQQQQRRASQLQTLHEYSRQLVSAENYNQIGQVVLEAVDDLTQLDGAGVYLINDHVKKEGTIGVSAQTLTTDDQTDKPRELIPIVARHPDTKIGTNPPTLGPESIAWDVYQTQTKYWTGNVQSDDRRYAKDTAVRSEGIIPLDEFGVLLVASLSVDKFNKIDQLVCQVLASNLTVALDQVHNQLELKQNRDLLSRTEQLADAGGWLYDTQTETLQ